MISNVREPAVADHCSHHVFADAGQVSGFRDAVPPSPSTPSPKPSAPALAVSHPIINGRRISSNLILREELDRWFVSAPAAQVPSPPGNQGRRKPNSLIDPITGEIIEVSAGVSGEL
jgi:hypothetical protein